MLRSIHFTGDPAMQSKSIRKLFLIQEGEPCDTVRIQTGVQRINNLRLFKLILPKDINFKQDDSTYQVDVYIPLKQKPGQQ